jgi:hypothetical protein
MKRIFLILSISTILFIGLFFILKPQFLDYLHRNRIIAPEGDFARKVKNKVYIQDIMNLRDINPSQVDSKLRNIYAKLYSYTALNKTLVRTEDLFFRTKNELIIKIKIPNYCLRNKLSNLKNYYADSYETNKFKYEVDQIIKSISEDMIISYNHGQDQRLYMIIGYKPFYKTQINDEKYNSTITSFKNTLTNFKMPGIDFSQLREKNGSLKFFFTIDQSVISYRYASYPLFYKMDEIIRDINPDFAKRSNKTDHILPSKYAYEFKLLKISDRIRRRNHPEVPGNINERISCD